MKIAKAAPFEGAPKINSASVFGASTGKEFMYRIPVTGKRPIDIEAIGLKDGMKIKDGIISGKIDEDCEFDIEISAKNELGEARKSVKFKIHYDNPLLTPLMGFTSWNAFRENVRICRCVFVQALFQKHIGVSPAYYNGTKFLTALTAA